MQILLHTRLLSLTSSLAETFTPDLSSLSTPSQQVRKELSPSTDSFVPVQTSSWQEPEGTSSSNSIRKTSRSSPMTTPRDRSPELTSLRPVQDPSEIPSWYSQRSRSRLRPQDVWSAAHPSLMRISASAAESAPPSASSTPSISQEITRIAPP